LKAGVASGEVTHPVQRSQHDLPYDRSRVFLMDELGIRLPRELRLGGMGVVDFPYDAGSELILEPLLGGGGELARLCQPLVGLTSFESSQDQKLAFENPIQVVALAISLATGVDAGRNDSSPGDDGADGRSAWCRDQSGQCGKAFPGQRIRVLYGRSANGSFDCRGLIFRQQGSTTDVAHLNLLDRRVD
jgi:virulence-associated protein VagC